MKLFTAATAKSLQLCPTLCDPIDGSPPGSCCPWGSPAKNTGVGYHFLLQNYSQVVLNVGEQMTRLISAKEGKTRAAR